MKIRREPLNARPILTISAEWNGEQPAAEMPKRKRVKDAMVRVVSESPPERVSEMRAYVQGLRKDLLAEGALTVRCDPVRVVGRRAYAVVKHEALTPRDEVERWMTDHPPRGCDAADVRSALEEIMSEEGL